jgi:hypothetical protein
VSTLAWTALYYAAGPWREFVLTVLSITLLVLLDTTGRIERFMAKVAWLLAPLAGKYRHGLHPRK